MIQDNRYIGVLKKVVEKETPKGGKYFTAWIESPNTVDTFFHPSSLIDKEQENLIDNDRFIFFETKLTKTDRGERQDSIKSTLTCEKTMVREILDYDDKSLKFIFKHASNELKSKMSTKLKNLEYLTTDESILNKIDLVKKRISEPTIASPKSKEEPLSTTSPAQPSSFLENIFQSNTSEYNQIFSKFWWMVSKH